MRLEALVGMEVLFIVVFERFNLIDWHTQFFAADELDCGVEEFVVEGVDVAFRAETDVHVRAEMPRQKRVWRENRMVDEWSRRLRVNSQ